MMRELPDRDDGAEDKNRIDQGFEPGAVLLFGANQESVSRFEVVHKFIG